MKRKGIVMDVIPRAIVVGFAVLMLVEMFIYTEAVSGDLSLNANTFYTDVAVGEAALTAPCATTTRAVFYRSSVVSGDFECLSPPNDIYLSFTLADGTVYAWRVQGNDDGTVSISQLSNRFSWRLSRSYDVLIYDANRDTYTTAELRVGGR